jgi:DNA-3-methyladenine glycosylase
VSSAGGLAPVSRRLLSGDPLDVAPRLLNTLLVHGERVVRIVEVEAYRGLEDPASHAYRGPTKRNATMFGPAGHLYVYFTYGMHWCANIVCGPESVAGAVLLRAAAPVAGAEEMWAARQAARRERDLCSGPAKLCQAMGITGDFDGADLLTGDLGIRLCSDATRPPARPGNGPRIGITAAAEHPWRWWIAGDPNVSGRERAPAGPSDARRVPKEGRGG